MITILVASELPPSRMIVTSVITKRKKMQLFPPGIEPGTFRVLGGCDNHYTTETHTSKRLSYQVLCNAVIGVGISLIQLRIKYFI